MIVKATRYLGQRDPLSPLLFTSIIDVLSTMLLREENGLLEHFLMERSRTRVSHLQFANDTIFFLKLMWKICKTLN